MNYLERVIPKLKEFTISNKSFSDTMDYFLKSIAENSKAKEQFEPIKDKDNFYHHLLETLFSKRHPDITVTSVLLMEHKKFSFIHGSAFLNVPKMCALYFFTDINIGMVVISSFDGKNDFYRITNPQMQLRDRAPIILSDENHNIH